jgi:hypothetical protein
MPISLNPTQKDPERAFALQKYLLLHSQHDALQKHLQQITTSVPTTNTSPSHSPSRYSRHSSISSESPSLSSSPETPANIYLSHNPITTSNSRHQRSSSVAQSHSRPPIVKRRSSLPAIIDESLIGEIEQDETKLKMVNQQIKSTLTELLNCESVRGDTRYRMWVQTRLMDVEQELKRDRTRSCERRASVGV